MDARKSYIVRPLSSGNETVEMSAHGIYFAREGAIELLTMPSAIGVVVNDWQEENGLELDVKSLQVGRAEIALRFMVIGQTRVEFLDRLAYFRELLQSEWLKVLPAGMHHRSDGYHIDQVAIEGYRHLGRSLFLSGVKAGEVMVRCRLKDCNAHRGGVAIGSLPLSRVMAGDMDFAKMGIQVQEVYDTLLLPASFKAYTYTEKSREIAMRCFSIGDTYQEVEDCLAQCYNQISGKQFYLTYGGGGKVRCYYLSMTDVKAMRVGSRKGITFTLNFKTT